MMMRGKSVYLLVLNFILLTVYLFLYFLFENLHFYPVQFLKYSIVILVVFSIITGKLYLRWLHSYFLFLITFTLFLCSRVFLDLLGFEDLAETALYIYYHISDKTLCISLFLLIVSLLAVNTGFYYSFYKNRFNKPPTYIEANQYPKILKSLILILLIVALPGTILKLWSDFQFIRSNGYLAIFSDFQSAPLPYRLSWFLFGAVFPLILLFKSDKKTTMIWLCIMLVISVLDALKGSRNSLIRPLLYFGWFYYTYYSKNDLKLFRLAIVFVVFVYVANLFAVYRIGSSLDDFGLQSVIVSLFYSQGVSFTIIPVFIDHAEQLVNPSKFYIFSPLYDFVQRFINPVFREGHSYEYVKATLNVDHKIMFAVNPDAYLSGSGFGSTYIIELYALGGILAIAFGSFFLGYLISKMETLFLTSNTMLVVSWFWISTLTWMSRGSYLPDLFQPMLTFFILIALLGLVEAVRNKKNNLNFNTWLE